MYLINLNCKSQKSEKDLKKVQKESSSFVSAFKSDTVTGQVFYPESVNVALSNAFLLTSFATRPILQNFRDSLLQFKTSDVPIAQQKNIKRSKLMRFCLRFNQLIEPIFWILYLLSKLGPSITNMYFWTTNRILPYIQFVNFSVWCYAFVPKFFLICCAKIVKFFQILDSKYFILEQIQSFCINSYEKILIPKY